MKWLSRLAFIFIIIPIVGSEASITASQTEKIQFQCTTCQKVFKTKHILSDHLKAVHGPKNHVCMVCQKSFSRKDYLDLHIRTHTGAKPHECTICKKRFTQKSNLNRHTKIHLREASKNENQSQEPSLRASQESPVSIGSSVLQLRRQDQTSIMQSSFNSASQLQGPNLESLQFLIPQDQEPSPSPLPDTAGLQEPIATPQFQCAFCFKLFKKKSALNLHFKKVHGPKNHLCNACGKRFSHRYDLTKHERTHTGVKPYECNICKKRFSQSSNLYTHKKNVHEHTNSA